MMDALPVLLVVLGLAAVVVWLVSPDKGRGRPTTNRRRAIQRSLPARFIVADLETTGAGMLRCSTRCAPQRIAPGGGRAGDGWHTPKHEDHAGDGFVAQPRGLQEGGRDMAVARGTGRRASYFPAQN
jgi:hypothetical protein